jgi:hypothetical protein
MLAGFDPPFDGPVVLIHDIIDHARIAVENGT